MSKIIISKGLEATLNKDCTWTVNNKLVRGFFERFLNNISKDVLRNIKVSQGDPKTNILYQCGEVLGAKVIDTEPKTSKYDPNIQN